MESVICSLQSAVCSLQSANVRHRLFPVKTKFYRTNRYKRPDLVATSGLNLQPPLHPLIKEKYGEKSRWDHNDACLWRLHSSSYSTTQSKSTSGIAGYWNTLISNQRALHLSFTRLRKLLPKDIMIPPDIKWEKDSIMQNNETSVPYCASEMPPFCSIGGKSTGIQTLSTLIAKPLTSSGVRILAGFARRFAQLLLWDFYKRRILYRLTRSQCIQVYLHQFRG